MEKRFEMNRIRKEGGKESQVKAVAQTGSYILQPTGLTGANPGVIALPCIPYQDHEFQLLHNNRGDIIQEQNTDQKSRLRISVLSLALSKMSENYIITYFIERSRT